MSRFNQKYKTPTVENEAGGEAYAKDARLELVGLALTSFVQNQFYRTAATQLTDLDRLLKEVDPLFAAKTAIFARDKFNMRSITHAIAAKLGPRVSGQSWGKRFYAAVVQRPDDMTEILSLIIGGKKTAKGVTAAMKDGFSLAFGKFDAYQLAKYRGEGKQVSLVDAVRVIHPKVTEKNGEAIKALVYGTLKSTETWEAKLSKAGSDKEAKEDAWTELLDSGKLGYFALLRNLRNISKQAPEKLDTALAQLVDPTAIKKSKVLPFRFMTAFDEVGGDKKIADALNKAMEISLANVPELPGKTLIAVDVSSSMWGRPMQIASQFGAIIALRAKNGMLMKFAGSAAGIRYVSGTPLAMLASLVEKRGDVEDGTDFNLVFSLNEKFDTIVILSDMQPWIGRTVARNALGTYRNRTGASPKVFSFDLAGHSTTQFLPGDDVYHLAGFSDKAFDIMSMLSEDRNALIHAVEAVQF